MYVPLLIHISFSGLNQPSSTNEASTDKCNVLLDEFPTVMETRKAVQQLSSGKATGADAINAEVYAFGVCVWGGCYPCQRKLRS